MFHKILVPVDYSEYSREALNRAVALARANGAALVVLNVVEPLTPYADPLGGYIGLHQEVTEAARLFLASLDPLLEHIPHEAFIRKGQPGEEIVACAEETGADLILMATHGRSGLSRLVMGSTTEAVMRHAHVPVMTWRAAALKGPQQPSSVHMTSVS
jgi:nucleotide-binding universal stress UspA family protein